LAISTRGPLGCPIRNIMSFWTGAPVRSDDAGPTVLPCRSWA